MSMLDQWLSGVPDIAHAECILRIERLADQLAARKVQFLCGAGMSKKSGLKLTSEIAVDITAQLLGKSATESQIKKLSTKFPFEALAQAYKKKFTASDLRALIDKKLGPGKSDTHTGHAALEYFASRHWIDRAYTTNFDDLLERGFGERHKQIVDKNSDELRDTLRQEIVPVIHLHGATGRDSDCLVTETQTYALNTPLAQVMKADIATNWFVWVGYSMSDVDLKTIYLAMREILSHVEIAKRPYVVLPFDIPEDANEAKKKIAEGDDKQEWRLADLVWDARGATFLPGKAEVFLPALRECADQAAARRIAVLIVTKKGGDVNDPSQLRQIFEESNLLAKKSGLGSDIDAMYLLAEKYDIEEDEL